MARQVLTYNSSLDNYRRAGILTAFTAGAAITAGNMVYLDGNGEILPAADPMLLFGRGGISGVAESTVASGEKVVVWQSGVFEYVTDVAQAIKAGQYLYVASNAISVDLGGGRANEISCGMAESATAGTASGEIVEVLITPTRKRSPYLYDSDSPYL